MKILQIAIYVLSVGLVSLGCDLQGSRQPTATEEKLQPTQAAAMDPERGLSELKGKVFSTGPNGETPTLANDITLTDAELLKIRDKQATAAIALHYGDNDWSNAQVAGLTAQFEGMGIEVIDVSVADFDADKQAANIKATLAKKPNILVAYPLAPAEVFKEAAKQGVKVVFMDNVPSGLKQGQDYVSVVSADNYGNGIASAHLMAKKLEGKGKIGIVYYNTDFFATQQCYEAFKKTIEVNYPDIQILEEQGIAGSNFAANAEEAASAMLANHADLNGIWAVWDVPAEGVIAAARSAGRTDLVITTIDLGLNVTVEMAKGGLIGGVGAQRPFDQGVAEAKLAAYALLDKTAPAYVVLNALPVTKENALKSWQVVYHQAPPEVLTNAAK